MNGSGTAVGPQVCVGAVVVRDDCLLLVRRGRGPAAGEWSVPGGRVETGETLAEAVVREVAEETGLDVVCDELIGWVERIDPDHHFIIFDFGATPVGAAEAAPRAGDDAAEVAWVPLNDLGSLRLVDGLAEFLASNGVIDVFA